MTGQDGSLICEQIRQRTKYRSFDTLYSMRLERDQTIYLKTMKCPLE
jgi:hypothetical protein